MTAVLGGAPARAQTDVPASPGAGTPAEATPGEVKPKPKPRPRAVHPAKETPKPAPKTPAPKPPPVPAAPPPPPSLPPPLVVPTRPMPPPTPATVVGTAQGEAIPQPNGLRITFGPGSSDLNPKTEAAIRELVRSAPRFTDPSFTIVAVAPGTEEDPSTPRRLSLSRALAVRSVLITEGVPSARIYAKAMGASADAIAGGPPDRADVTVAGTTPATSGTPAPTVPTPSAPAQTTPAQTTPAQTAPAQTAPAQTAPAQTAPTQTVPTRGHAP